MPNRVPKAIDHLVPLYANQAALPGKQTVRHLTALRSSKEIMLDSSHALQTRKIKTARNAVRMPTTFQLKTPVCVLCRIEANRTVTAATWRFSQSKPRLSRLRTSVHDSFWTIVCFLTIKKRANPKATTVNAMYVAGASKTSFTNSIRLKL